MDSVGKGLVGGQLFPGGQVGITIFSRQVGITLFVGAISQVGLGVGATDDVGRDANGSENLVVFFSKHPKHISPSAITALWDVILYEPPLEQTFLILLPY